jgi:nucleoside-diphosphate-sugar epimerase
MKILFIGGTGVISSGCVILAAQRGFDLTILNRGTTTIRPAPVSIQQIHSDIRNLQSVKAAIGSAHFDVVVDFLSFNAEQLSKSVSLFGGKIGQYVFISSASAYQKPLNHLPITESTPLSNPFWEYSRQKIACEELLTQKYQNKDFPVTIVRPSHTYDRTLFPMRAGYTVLNRMRQGKPVVVHGDGSSLWVLTHHYDFAKGLLGILGNPSAIGEAFHITSDFVLTWDQIYNLIGAAAGIEPQLVHIPSDMIAKHDRNWGDSLLGDKAHSVIFDNTKIKKWVPDFSCKIPFEQGAQEIVAWYDQHPEQQRVDPYMDQLFDRLIHKITEAAIPD